MTLEELKRQQKSIPPAIQEALVQHVRGLKEEDMKRRVPFALAFSLAMVLIIGTVAAAGYLFSVSPWVPQDKQDQITVIGDRHENQWMVLHINDAYRADSQLQLALNLSHKDGADPVYLYPELSATAGGKHYDTDVQSGYELIDGVWLPELWNNDNGPGNYQLEVLLVENDGQNSSYDIQADTPFQWHLRFHVLRMAQGWRMEHRRDLPTQHSELTAIVQAAHRDKVVLLTEDDLAMEFLDFGPVPAGFEAEDWMSRPTWQRLLDTGAFVEVDTFERSFGTP